MDVTSRLCFVTLEQVEEMISACSQKLRDKLEREMTEAHFIGVMIDESCGIAIYKKLIIYVKIVVDVKSKVVFVRTEMSQMEQQTPLLAKSESFILFYEKLDGIGSDVAAVNDRGTQWRMS